MKIAILGSGIVGNIIATKLVQLGHQVSMGSRIAMVAKGDIAEVALKKLVRRDWAGAKTISLSGPEDVSFNRAAAIFEGVLERPVKYSEISVDQFIRNLVRSGASVNYARSAAPIFAMLAQGISAADVRTTEPEQSTTLADWTRAELLPMMAAPDRQSEPKASPALGGQAGSKQSLFSH